MAYSDTRGLSRLNAVSVGGAFLINGVMLAGFVMLKPDILPEKIWTIMDTYDVRPDKPIEIEPKPRDEPRKDSVVTAPQTPERPVTTTDSDFFVRDTGQTSFGDIPGPVVEPTPIKIDPVFKTPRLDPRYAGALQPSYPPGAIRNNLEGVVTVKVLIGTDGRVKDVQAVRSDEQLFLEATRKQALGKWRFLPATRDGVAIESWREMTVRFVLPPGR